LKPWNSYSNARPSNVFVGRLTEVCEAEMASYRFLLALFAKLAAVELVML
jgi:hypothetical protein